MRIVDDGLAHTGTPMGQYPPAPPTCSLVIAISRWRKGPRSRSPSSSHTRTIDLVKITVDDRPPEHFAMMAGIGVDAMIMDETDDNLKDKVGSAAYFVGREGARAAAPTDEGAARRQPTGQARRHAVRGRQRRQAAWQPHPDPGRTS